MADFSRPTSSVDHSRWATRVLVRTRCGDAHQLVHPTKATNEGEFLFKLIIFYLLNISISGRGKNFPGNIYSLKG
jgi:hypothetical protein